MTAKAASLTSKVMKRSIVEASKLWHMSLAAKVVPNPMHPWQAKGNQGKALRGQWIDANILKRPVTEAI